MIFSGKNYRTFVVYPLLTAQDFVNWMFIHCLFEGQMPNGMGNHSGCRLNSSLWVVSNMLLGCKFHTIG